jgi:hypothetical protein
MNSRRRVNSTVGRFLVSESNMIALVCNTPNARIFEIVLSLALITIGVLVLIRALQGRLKRNRIAGVTDPNLGCGVVAVGLIVLGVMVLASALLWLDC